MDCTDIIIGSVKGGLHRVQDMYTRDRSTPREDYWYAGNDDLTGSAGSQVDGYTTIVFRRRLRANHQSDHSIIDGQMTFIWAMGQGIDMYQHAPNTGLEDCTASDYRFYRHDEIKYHGTGPDRRGASSINLFDKPDAGNTGVCNSMSGEYRLPSNCISSGDDFNCDYFASWEFDQAEDNINFVLKSRQDQSRWVGLGISSDQFMPNTDVIAAWIDQSGNPVVQDRWATGRSPPPVDEINNINDVTGNYENGVMTITFSRPRNTGDSNDLPFSDGECQHLIYTSGRLDGAGNNIFKHDSTPAVSSNKICIRSCEVEAKKSTTLRGEFRFPEETFRPELKDPNSNYYKSLKDNMEKWIRETFATTSFMRNSGGEVDGVEVTGFIMGSIIVHYLVTVSVPDIGVTDDGIRREMYNSVKITLLSNGDRLLNSPMTAELKQLTSE
ncbi:unnamed protein product [Clavelina lepadiformis]|uniref:DOMON domain-containing protein n=1 Tax=Clavelina lepadiformis TaxID=159417 RepID=A0ABP0FWH7_CLALP